MINALRLFVVVCITTLALFFGSPELLAVGTGTTVSGYAFSDSGPVEIANIGKYPNIFSGTLITEEQTHFWSTILNVYTDNNGKLWVTVETGDDQFKVQRTSDYEYTLPTPNGDGKLSWDKDAGDLIIDGSGAGWMKGTLSGMYVASTRYNNS